jgi:hypothetical protein
MKEATAEERRLAQMSESWITVATFNLHVQATLAKSVLDAAGIECWLRDEHVARMYAGAYGAAFGGIKLQVRPEDEQVALAILKQAESSAPEPDFE